MKSEKYDVDKLTDEINFNENFIGYQKNDIILTNRETSILDSFNINYKIVGSVSELLYIIDDVIEDSDSGDELEEISRDISDRNYYNNYKK